MKKILLYLIFSLTAASAIASCTNVSAGPDQTVCRYSVVTLAAHGGAGTWTSLALNHDTIVFANPSDSNTTATGFDGTGVDTLVWTSNGCSDTMLVTIAPNGGTEQMVSCLVSFPGGTATMTGTGTGIWTLLSGPGTSKITDSAIATTTIDSFSAPGTYEYIWTTSTCKDTVPVVVTAKPNAGANQTICRHAIVPLVAHGGGRGSWSTLSTNPDTIIFANPNDSITTARGFNGTTSDKVVWTANGCADTITITIAANGGPNKTVSCAVLPGGSATMAGTGTGTWTAAPGNPGTSVITTPTSPTTTITTYSVAGTYRYVWTTSTCSDTVDVVVTGKPNAGADQTICQFTGTVLAGTGTGTWTVAPGNPDLVVFTNPNSPTTPVANFGTVGTYTLYWSLDGCSDTMLIHVTSRPNGGPAQTTCQYSTATMDAVGTGTWSALSTNPSTTTIVTPTSATSEITGFADSGTYRFLWTVSSCPDTVDVYVTPKPNGGPNQSTCIGSSVTMAGVGTGTWSQMSTNPVQTTITNPSLSNTTITNFSAFGTYKFIWAVNGCQDTVSVSINTGGPDTTILCYSLDTAHLHAQGTGTWTIAGGNPGTSTLINPTLPNASVAGFSDSGTYYYIWTSAGCSDTVSVVTKNTCPPSNDNINTPVVIGRLGITPGRGCGHGATTTVTGTNLGATPSNPYPYQGACLVNSNNYPNDVWYTFHPSGFTTILTVTSATITNPMIDVWQGVPPNLIGIGCVIGSGGTATLVLYNLDTTLTYYVQIAGENGSQNGSFTMTAHDSIDCTGCFHSGYITATPPPQNNSYSPGETVMVCYTVVDYIQYDANWFHGLQTSFGAGWDTTTIVVDSTPASCDGNGVWGWYPTGIHATRGNGSNIPYPMGWYYWSQSPNQGSGGPGNNYGDDCTSHTWKFCLSITARDTCMPGVDLSLTFNTTGDGESGGWDDFGCSDDHGITQYAVGSCCPPVLSGIDATCGNSNGIVTASPTSGSGPWTYAWIDTALNFSYTQSNVHGIDTVRGLLPGTYTLLTLDSFQCPANGRVTIVDTTFSNAGPDQTICRYGSITMAGSGHGNPMLWTALPTNPTTTTITTPSSFTTAVSGFDSAGTYRFVLTSGTCTDTMNVIVNPLAVAGPNQTICQGTTTAMAAQGTGYWEALSTNPSVTTIDTPTLTTTYISNFIDTGTYKFVWVATPCSDTMSVHVLQAANAGPSQTVSCAILPGGSAIMAAVSTGTWTPQSGNVGTAVITTPASATTTITGFTVAGTYGFIWTTTGGCIDSATVTVTAKPNAGPDQIVTCYPADSTATLAGVATPGGIWTPEAYNPGSAVIADSANPATTVTSFTTAGTYYFIWTNPAGCADTAAIDVTEKPNAGPNDTLTCIILPGGSATMGAVGTGVWLAQSNNPGTATITTPTSPATTITDFSAPGTYNFIWSNGACADTAAIVITAKPNAGDTQIVSCAVLPGGSATMAATGAGTWTAQTGNPGTAVITNPTSPTTTITTYSAPGTYYFNWTNASGCTDTTHVTVTQKPNAGPDQTVTCAILPGGSATMAGTGTGTWTNASGQPGSCVITTLTSPTTTITTFSAPGTYSFVWTNASGCTDTANIVVTAKPNAGTDQTVTCAILPGGSATMTGTGAGTWTAEAGNPGTATITNPSSPTTTITTYTAPGTYNFIWTNASGCTDTAAVVVTAKPNAGPDQTVLCYPVVSTATMAATGTGTWTALTGNPGTEVITTPTSPTTTITNYSAAGIYYFAWTNASGCADTATVTVTEHPNAGPDQAVVCAVLPGGSATMAATGTGTWTPLPTNPGTETITNPALPTTTITDFSLPGTYGFVWTLGACSDTANVVVTAKPVAGPAQTVTCAILPGGSATMAATGAGTWSPQTGNPGTASITNPTSPTTTITTFSAPGTYAFIWTNASGCADTTSVVVTAKPNAGPDQTVTCAVLPGGSATMAGTGAGTWSPIVTPPNPGTAVITNPTSPTTTITTFSAPGLYSFVWTNASGCTDTANITVTAKPYAGTDQTVTCAVLPGGSATMTGNGAGTWAPQTGNPGTASITNLSSPTTTITTFSAPGTYYFIWTNASGCTDTAAVVVTAKPNAGPDQTVTCAVLPGGSATMAGTGAGTWTPQTGNPGTASITNPTNPTTTITTFSAPGTYAFIWTNASGCTDTANITVTQEPVLTLANAAYCLGGTATLSVVATPAGGTYQWNPPGNQTTATITVSPTTTTYYSVTYTLGSCSATISDTVTVYPLPVASVSTIVSVCTADNGKAIVNPSAGTPGYTYVWSSSPAQTTDTASQLAPGTYQVTVTDIHHCTTTASGTVGLETPTVAVSEISQHNLRCFDDASGDIYISLTDTAGEAGSYTYTYLWNSSPASTAQNLTNVQAGTYTVVVTDQFGCTGTASYTLTQPTAISASLTGTNPQCFGYANGTATVSASGGTAPYTYAWNTNPVQTNAQATGLAAGPYTVSVTDDSLCVQTFSTTLTNPLQIIFGDSVIVNPTCYNDSNATALVAPMNGIGSYTFLWSNGDTTNPATGLAGGSYSVTATDNNGCTGSTTVTITPPTQVEVSITPTNILCFGYADGAATALATGGIPPYSYRWNNSDSTATINNLPIGTYTVTATDNNGCTNSGNTTLTQPSLVTVKDLLSTRTSCPATADGTVTDTAQGGTGSFSYTLEDTAGNVIQAGNTTGTFTGLAAGIYTVVATDQNGCTVSDTITVPRAPFNTYSDSSVPTTCYGIQYKDGVIFVQGYTIPNGPFQYSVDGGAFQSTAVFYNLSAGSHTITAQDNYGCDTSFNVIVDEPLPAVVQILPGDSTITAGSTLQLSTTFGPFSTDSIKAYTWSPGTGLSCIDCPAPEASPYANQTTYTVVITYNQGCTASASVQINSNGQPPVYIPNAFTPNGDGVNDVWYVFGTGIKDFKATIFDRWGEKVFESTDQSQGWDGTYRGQLQPPGVFVYVVELVYLSGEQETKQGSVSLIR